MWAKTKAALCWLWSTCRGSSVIVFARLQVLAGTIWVGLQGVDVSPVVKDPKWLMYWIIGSNIINELLRRHNAEANDDGKFK